MLSGFTTRVSSSFRVSCPRLEKPDVKSIGLSSILNELQVTQLGVVNPHAEMVLFVKMADFIVPKSVIF